MGSPIRKLGCFVGKWQTTNIRHTFSDPSWAYDDQVQGELVEDVAWSQDLPFDAVMPMIQRLSGDEASGESSGKCLRMFGWFSSGIFFIWDFRSEKNGWWW